MIKYDCHTHTSFSSDSESDPVSQIEAAIALGLDGICFTDHMDYSYPVSPYFEGNFEFDPEAYYKRMSELKEKYADRINILIGIELGLRNEKDICDDLVKRYDKLTEDYPFDFVIGSTHCLEHTDPAYEDYWNGKTAREGLRLYFEAILDNIRKYDCFDSSGHLDYLVRYIPERDREGDIWKGPTSYEPRFYADIIDEILLELIRRGKALEINTAGLKYGIGFAHPKDEILTRYRKLGGELITIGSDGHKPEHLAYDFPAVCKYLLSRNFKYYSVYEARTPVGLVLFEL